MLTKYLKRAPTLIVIGVTGFAVWPILFPEGESTEPKGSSKPPVSARPSVSITALSRNPFRSDQDPAAVPAAPKATSAELAKSGKDAKAATLPNLSAEDDKFIAGLRLSGTFVDGREQLALIDNKIYARGDALKAADGSPMPYIVAGVWKDRAVLRRGRRDFVLGFSNMPRPALVKAEGPRTPAKAEEAVKGEVTARAEPPARVKGPASARPRGGTGDPKDLIPQLLSGLGGSSTAPGSLGGMASGAGINPSTISAGIDALMGKLDNIGREGGPSLPSTGAGETTP